MRTKAVLHFQYQAEDLVAFTNDSLGVFFLNIDRWREMKEPLMLTLEMLPGDHIHNVYTEDRNAEAQ